VETAFSLARALKQAIETDLCDGNGFPTAESRVVFKKIKKEHSHV
jgi:hypothetical protein